MEKKPGIFHSVYLQSIVPTLHGSGADNSFDRDPMHYWKEEGNDFSLSLQGFLDVFYSCKEDKENVCSD